MWIFFSILSAFGWASSDALVKKVMRKGEADEFFCAWIRSVFALIFLLPLFFKFYAFPIKSNLFWLIHPIWLPLEITALFLYMRAIKISPLSLTLPFLALTPAFLLLINPLILGEKTSGFGVMGVMFIVAGSYVLNLKHESTRIKTRIYTNFLAPFKAIVREKGSILMIIVAFIYSFTSICGKVLVNSSEPLFFSLYFAVVITVLLTPFGLHRLTQVRRHRLTQKEWKWLLWSGMFYGLMIVSHMLAIQSANVTYMIALKRLSGVFGCVYGLVLFKEKEFAKRIAGSIFMILGAFIISYS